jgi:hypothetical protein
VEAALRLGADNQIVLLLLIETKCVLGSAITGTLCVAVQATPMMRPEVYIVSKQNEGIFTIFALAPAVSGTYCLWRLVSKYVA